MPQISCCFVARLTTSWLTFWIWFVLAWVNLWEHATRFSSSFMCMNFTKLHQTRSFLIKNINIVYIIVNREVVLWGKNKTSGSRILRGYQVTDGHICEDDKHGENKSACIILAGNLKSGILPYLLIPQHQADEHEHKHRQYDHKDEHAHLVHRCVPLPQVAGLSMTAAVVWAKARDECRPPL